MAEAWTEDPTEHQNFWYDALGDIEFDEYETNTDDGLLILYRKIGFAIYGVPQEEPSDNNGQTGYNEKMLKYIKNVATCLLDVNTKKREKKTLIQMSIVFVYVDHGQRLMQFPVFRVLLNKWEWKFVDIDCRVYSTWESFLAENELPAGKFCWPEGGIYHSDSEGNLQLGWGTTPNAELHRKVLARVDTASSVAAIGATGLIIGGMLAPVLAPAAATAGVCAAVTGVYSAVRSGAALVDRGAHGQTVNPLSSTQVAASWLSVVGSTVSLAAGAMVSRAANLARNGQVMTRVEEAACNALNITSLVVNATGVGFGAFSIGERLKEGELTPLDVFQFSASVLFFAHSTMNFQTASTIIENTQKGVIDDFEKGLRSNRHRKQFRKLMKSTVSSSDTQMEGNAKVIRSIHNINNVDDFFAGMVRIRKDLTGHKTVFSENGNIIINGGVEIHPMKMYELGKQQRLEVLSMARQAANGAISDATFVNGFNKVVARSGPVSTANSQRTKEAETILSAQLQTMVQNWQIGLAEVRLVIVIVDELTALVKQRTDNKYVKWWHKIWTHVSKLTLEMLNTYEDAMQFEALFSEFMNGERLDLEKLQRVTAFLYFAVKIYDRYKNHIDDLIRDIRLCSEA